MDDWERIDQIEKELDYLKNGLYKVLEDYRNQLHDSLEIIYRLIEDEQRKKRIQKRKARSKL